MNKKPNPEMIDDENPEWTDEMFKKAVPLSGLPKELQNTLRRHRGLQKKPTKIPTTIRLDEDVITALRAMGKGWQTRLNDATREWLKQQSRL
ncbi:BrnA antitoxin family protein [Oxalobacter aliiformigenes]|uniref:BrnA antitoxin family protein n=1 Tax=Oxalobacter aliiformigenes TaxID=2946593 RepID=UPI0022AECD01|nr:BrnA antitoxin family protein [Oxalobacter aliiformigenes]MCZ4065701.1 BrnA antitoxin family protein [Oxalobacter aliiformigenes]WAV98667.1 BrnA antitoxin family protein [Oxalobacter aliiformigenes]